jgi:hypothetical protein
VAASAQAGTFGARPGLPDPSVRTSSASQGRLSLGAELLSPSAHQEGGAAVIRALLRQATSDDSLG